eukprot:2707303-Alexandrium_andersonii.AAC.1
MAENQTLLARLLASSEATPANTNKYTDDHRTAPSAAQEPAGSNILQFPVLGGLPPPRPNLPRPSLKGG